MLWRKSWVVAIKKVDNYNMSSVENKQVTEYMAALQAKTTFVDFRHSKFCTIHHFGKISGWFGYKYEMT